MKLSWAQKVRLQKKEREKALEELKQELKDNRIAEKRERLNNSFVCQTLNSEKESLENVINNATAEIEKLSSKVKFTLEESISLTNKKGEVVEGKKLNIDLSCYSGLSRFKRSLKRLLKNNGLDAEKAFKANNAAIIAAEVYYRSLVFQKAKIQDAEQKLASVEKKMENPMKAHRMHMVKVAKANSWVLKYDGAHEPAATARAQRRRISKFNRGKKVFLEIYGDGKLPVDVATDSAAENPATAEFVAKVAQLNGAEIDAPALSGKIFATYKAVKAHVAATAKRSCKATKKAVKKTAAKVAKTLTTQQKIALRKAKATTQAQKAKAEATTKATKTFVKDAIAFFKKQAGFEDALEVLGYKVGPKALKGLEALADLMGYGVLKVEGTPIDLVEVASLV